MLNKGMFVDTLHCTAKWNMVQIAELLLNAGMFVDTLHCTAKGNNVQIAELALNVGGWGSTGKWNNAHVFDS